MILLSLSSSLDVTSAGSWVSISPGKVRHSFTRRSIKEPIETLDARPLRTQNRTKRSSDSSKLSFPGAVYNFGQPPFSVEVKQFNPSIHTVSVVTLRGHPIAGYRYWRVREIDRPNHLMVETGALDEPGPTPFNSLMFRVMKGVRLDIWQKDFEYIAKDIGAAIGPRSIVRGHGNGASRTFCARGPLVSRRHEAGRRDRGLHLRSKETGSVSTCSADRTRIGGFGGQIGRSAQRVFE